MRMTDDYEGEFWIEPVAGLGNRMQVLASAYFLSQKYHKKLCILWNNESHLAADFEDIFEALPGVRVVKATTDGYRAKPFLRIKSEWKRRKLSTKCGYAADIDQWPRSMSQEKLDAAVEDGVRNAKDVYVRSWRIFAPVYERQEITLDFLKPSEKVQLRGKDVFERIDTNTVGVHIRRTDHELAIADSPNEAFWKEMQKEIETDGHCHFFLATDDREVEREAVQRFGDKVLLKSNKSWGRRQRDGMLDACVELWALSKCRKILGSKGSTFGMIAAKLGNGRLEIVTKEQKDHV